MSWCSMLFLSLTLSFFADVGADQIPCEESKCGDDGVAIRFPFRLKHQPNHCGYPGFELSCDGSHTVLELPISAKFFVRRIDYKSQRIEMYEPSNCFVREFLKIRNLSTSPFHFGSDLDNYSFFNCSEDTLGYSPYYDTLQCFGGSSYKIYAVPSDSAIEELPTNCFKIYNTTLPSTKYNRPNQSWLRLSWQKPNCGQYCETKRKKCRLKSNATKVEIKCFNPKPKPRKGESTKFVAIGGAPILALLLLVAYRAYSSNKLEKDTQRRIKNFLEDYRALKPSRYSYADIKHITSQFKDKLGEGAFGTVFKGKLSEDFFVAVKILNNSKGNGEEFINEIGTIGRIHHVNVVRLVGYCADGFRRALVYEFLHNGSLQQYISSPDTDHFLGWKNLQDVALGIAKGIEYLHQGCDQRILHFDIKPHNVLLDHNFTPKISDFGLAKLCSKDQSIVSMTTARGTMGYIAPEVFSRNFGNVSYKSDVYSFGMLLLEMVGGRKITNVTEDNTSQVYYPEWIYNLLEDGEDLRIRIEEEGDSTIAKKLAIVGVWCIQWHPVDRPSMKVVVQMLQGGETLSMPPNPFASTDSTSAVANMPRRRMNFGLDVIAESE
ncbi:putative receptor-like protein kinase [Morus notabilis]|uniref:Putative receptor-like protein kinase n=1 Tax=Morus notabilis TaxID=981085 RepID=W9SLF7_9ROSA|nr:rust resistance kinase Lr10 [Morus notabilis]EXC36756.1 putative receptor-like protein kinase [Morus notabilis]